MNAMKRVSIYSMLAFVSLSASAANFENVTPGTLASLLTDETIGDTELVLSGVIDARDFEAIKTMTNLTDLDLKDVSIAAYTPAKPIVTSVTQYQADELPPMALFGMHLKTVTLPATISSIGSSALAGNDFVTIELPATLTSIGEYAFYDCNSLKIITMPAAVTSLGEYSFASCDSLWSVDLSNSQIKELPAYVFYNDVTLPTIGLDNLTAIGESAFAGCSSFSEVVIPSGLKTIGASAFLKTALTSIVLPESTSQIGAFAFANCSELVSATIKCSSATLGEGVFFYDAAFTTLDAAGLTIVPNYCFSGNSAFLISDDSSLLSGVSTIGDYALLDNPSESITLSSDLVYLGDGAMEGMTSLESINATALTDKVPSLGENVFADINQSEVELTVTQDAADTWSAADQWKEFNIKTESSVDTTGIADTCKVKAHFTGTDLHIESGALMRSVTVYTTDGKKVYYSTPADTAVVVPTADFLDKVYVVVVVTDDCPKKVFKLIR